MNPMVATVSPTDLGDLPYYAMAVLMGVFVALWLKKPATKAEGAWLIGLSLTGILLWCAIEAVIEVYAQAKLVELSRKQGARWFSLAAVVSITSFFWSAVGTTFGKSEGLTLWEIAKVWKNGSKSPARRARNKKL